MLDLGRTAVVEVLHVSRLGEASRIPEAQWSLHSELVLERAQRGVREQSPIAPGRTREGILEKHACERHHGQAAVRDLRVESPGALGRILDALASDAEVALAEVARLLGVDRLVDHKFVEAAERDPLQPALQGNLVEGLDAVRDVCELQVQGRRAEARKLVVLRHDVAHGRIHGHTPMLDLGRTAVVEVLHIAGLAEAGRVPEAQGSLHTKFALKRAQRRGGVERPVTPSAAGQAVLEEHTHSGHHRQTTVRDFSVQFVRQRCRIRRGKHLEAIVSRRDVRIVGCVGSTSRGPRKLAVSGIRHNLGPTK